MNQWHEMAVEPGITPRVGGVDEKKESLPELSWLPEYKWDEIYLEPFTVKDRAWSLAQNHILPVSALLFSTAMAKWAGWVAGRSDLVVKDIAWRVGDALSDAAQSYAPQELLWRLSVSNSDLFRPLTGTGADSAVYYLKRAVVFFPGLYCLIPEMLWEAGIIGGGSVPINIEPARLQNHFGLTFVRSGSGKDLEAPPFACLDLDILRGETDFYYADSKYEQALLNLEEACRREEINRIRFYPVIEKHERGNTLGLYVQISIRQRPGFLVRFPAVFGQAAEMDWWTNAQDHHTLQGVFNKQDQYLLIEAWNRWKGYERPLANPFSEQVLISLTENLTQLVTSGKKQTEAKRACWQEKCWRYQDSDIEEISEAKDFAALAIPRQSMNHTIISAGSKGVFFVDDHTSQRVMEPRISLITNVPFTSTSSAALVGLETHLPWLPTRGENQIASSFVTSWAYGYLTRSLYSYAMKGEELPSAPRPQLQSGHESHTKNRLPAVVVTSAEGSETRPFIDRQRSESIVAATPAFPGGSEAGAGGLPHPGLTQLPPLSVAGAVRRIPPRLIPAHDTLVAIPPPPAYQPVLLGDYEGLDLISLFGEPRDKWPEPKSRQQPKPWYQFW